MRITKAATAVAALMAVLSAGEASAFTISPGNMRVTIDTLGAGDGSGSPMQCSIDGRCESVSFGGNGTAGNSHAAGAVLSAGAVADMAAAQKSTAADPASPGAAFTVGPAANGSVALASAAFAQMMFAGDIVGSSFSANSGPGQRATAWSDYGRASTGGGLANGAHTLSSRAGNDLSPIFDPQFGTTGRMRRLGDFGYPLVAGTTSVLGALADASVATLTDATATQQNALQTIVALNGNAGPSAADPSAPKSRLLAAAAVPEPNSLALVAVAVLALAGFGRRSWKSRR